MKRFVMAITLGCVLSGLVLAGEVPSVVPAPPANGMTQTTSPSPGEIPTSGVAEQISSEALTALLSVLSFLAI